MACFFAFDSISRSFLSSSLTLYSSLFLLLARSISLSWSYLSLLSTIFSLSSSILFWFLSCISRYYMSSLLLDPGR